MVVWQVGAHLLVAKVSTRHQHQNKICNCKLTRCSLSEGWWYQGEGMLSFMQFSVLLLLGNVAAC